MEIGRVKVTDAGKKIIQASRIGSREQKSVPAHCYSVAYRDGWGASIGIIDFGDSQDVRCLEVGKGAPEAVYRLLHGLRMSISEGPSPEEQWVELSQARIDPEVLPPWSNLKKATWIQLEDGSGTAVEDSLSEAGGALGTREDLLGDGAGAVATCAVCFRTASRCHLSPATCCHASCR